MTVALECVLCHKIVTREDCRVNGHPTPRGVLWTWGCGSCSFDNELFETHDGKPGNRKYPPMTDDRKSMDFIELVRCPMGAFDNLLKHRSLDPEVNIHARTIGGATAFHCFCETNDTDMIRHMLNLKRPFDCNRQCSEGKTPFFLACYEGNAEAVAMLLDDSRIDVNLADRYGRTPFSMAFQERSLNVMELILASDVLVCTTNTHRSWEKTDKLNDLIKEYEKDPVSTRGRLREETRARNSALAAELFSIVVLLCDDYLKIKEK